MFDVAVSSLLVVDYVLLGGAKHSTFLLCWMLYGSIFLQVLWMLCAAFLKGYFVEAYTFCTVRFLGVVCVE